MNSLYVSETSAEQYLIIREGDGKTVALVYDDKELANVLATAPELLEALQTLVYFCHKHSLMDEAFKDTFAPAKTAIAKAKYG